VQRKRIVYFYEKVCNFQYTIAYFFFFSYFFFYLFLLIIIIITFSLLEKIILKNLQSNIKIIKIILK